MQRLLMLVGVAVVAAAMYVAGSSASQQVRYAPEPQVVALEKKVATMNATLKQVKQAALAAVGIIGTCYLTTGSSTSSIAALPVTQFGGPTAGFLFGTNATSSAPRTALDVATSSPQEYLQKVTPGCVTGTALRHGVVRSRINRLERWIERTR